MRDAVYAAYPVFFPSTRRHTRCLSDWSSDVCSSDLVSLLAALLGGEGSGGAAGDLVEEGAAQPALPAVPGIGRAAATGQQRGQQRGRGDGWRRGEIGRASCRERVESYGDPGEPQERR